ncbi:MAG: hypothetical protein J6X70_07645, partial [Muribaculaceae bacterium]|nr:hypothetical protein [Muribaculaceae bacterium]
SINKRNTDLENLIKNVSKNNIESEEKKKDKNDNYLYIKKDMIKNEKYGRYNNLSKSKNYYNSNIYENKSYSKNNNEEYKMNQSPISLFKEIKTFNINSRPCQYRTAVQRHCCRGGNQRCPTRCRGILYHARQQRGLPAPHQQTRSRSARAAATELRLPCWALAGEKRQWEQRER